MIEVSYLMAINKMLDRGKAYRLKQEDKCRCNGPSHYYCVINPNNFPNYLSYKKWQTSFLKNYVYLKKTLPSHFILNTAKPRLLNDILDK